MLERLQKIISRAGIASRRHAEQLIVSGQVKVNGVVVTELGAKADPEKDHVEAAGRTAEQPVDATYFLLHKPPHVVSTMADPEGRATLRHVLRGLSGGVFPVGRLDYDTSGLILLTSDGKLADSIMKVSSNLIQVFWVKLKGRPSQETLSKVGHKAQARLRLLRAPGASAGHVENPWYEAELRGARREGLNQAFFAEGHPVEKVKRVRIGPLELGDLPEGEYRQLTPSEVESLRRAVQQASEQAASPVTRPAAPIGVRAFERKKWAPRPPSDRGKEFDRGSKFDGEQGRKFGGDRGKPVGPTGDRFAPRRPAASGFSHGEGRPPRGTGFERGPKFGDKRGPKFGRKPPFDRGPRGERGTRFDGERGTRSDGERGKQFGPRGDRPSFPPRREGDSAGERRFPPRGRSDDKFNRGGKSFGKFAPSGPRPSRPRPGGFGEDRGGKPPRKFSPPGSRPSGPRPGKFQGGKFGRPDKFSRPSGAGRPSGFKRPDGAARPGKFSRPSGPARPGGFKGSGGPARPGKFNSGKPGRPGGFSRPGGKPARPGGKPFGKGPRPPRRSGPPRPGNFRPRETE